MPDFRLLNLWHVSTFLAVVDTGSFRSAARQLGIAQPTVSQHVKQLEETVGSVLLQRARNHCVPTASGAMLLPAARSLVATAAHAVERLAEARVIIGACSNAGIYVLQPHLKRLRDDNAIDWTRLDLTIGTNPEILDKLEAGEIDLAVTEWWDERVGFHARPWRPEKLVVIVPPDHPWSARASITVEELTSMPLLGGERGTGTGTLLRRALGDTAAGRLRVERNLGSTEAVKHAVKAGLGISLCAESSVAEEIRWGTLRAVEIAGVALTKDLFIAIPRGLPAESRIAQIAERLLADCTASMAESRS